MADQDYATVSGAKVHRLDFAYAPEGSKPSEWKLPLHDVAHVRNALARYHQTDLPAGVKAAVYAKIKAAARKFGVEVSEQNSEGGHSRESGNPAARGVDARLRGHDGCALSEVRNGLVKLAVAYTGEFVRDGKKFSITPSDLKEMQRNLEKREAPIDYEHLSALPAGGVSPGWAKAAGWIRRPAGIEQVSGVRFEVSVKNSGTPHLAPDTCILWAWAELTPAALAMVKQKEYRYFSPEIHWNDVDEQGQKIGTRLAAGALTNRPFLKDLPPIEVSDADYKGLFGVSDDVGAGLVPARTGRPQGSPLPMVALSEGAKLVDLDSVHVPSASKQISVAYPQGGNASESEDGANRTIRTDDSQPRSNRGQPKEKPMAKKFSFRKLAEGPAQGKFGLYKNGELVMDEGEPVVFDEEDFPSLAPGDDGEDGDAPGASCPAEMRAREAARLGEIFREGRVDRERAVALAEAGEIRLDSLFRAQAAEKLVEQFIVQGKLLPRRRRAAFQLALVDEEGLRGLLSDARPMVDFTARGLAGAAHLAGSAQSELDEMVRQWIAEHRTDYSAALTEITRRNPELWRRASAEVSERTRSGEEEQE